MSYGVGIVRFVKKNSRRKQTFKYPAEIKKKTKLGIRNIIKL